MVCAICCTCALPKIVWQLGILKWAAYLLVSSLSRLFTKSDDNYPCTLVCFKEFEPTEQPKKIVDRVWAHSGGANMNRLLLLIGLTWLQWYCWCIMETPNIAIRYSFPMQTDQPTQPIFSDSTSGWLDSQMTWWRRKNRSHTWLVVLDFSVVNVFAAEWWNASELGNNQANIKNNFI